RTRSPDGRRVPPFRGKSTGRAAGRFRTSPRPIQRQSRQVRAFPAVKPLMPSRRKSAPSPRPATETRALDFYRRVVESARDVIFETDGAGVWTFLNPAWKELTGFTIEESLGRDFREFVHPEERGGDSDATLPFDAWREDRLRRECRFLHRSGGFRWLEAEVRLVRDAAGPIHGAAGTLSDVTVPRETQEAL